MKLFHAVVIFAITITSTTAEVAQDQADPASHDVIGGIRGAFLGGKWGGMRCRPKNEQCSDDYSFTRCCSGLVCNNELQDFDGAGRPKNRCRDPSGEESLTVE